jgi:chromosome segregation ATPase
LEVVLTQLDTHAGKLQAVEQTLKGYPQTFADLRHQAEGLTRSLDAQATHLEVLESRQGQADERLGIVERLAEQLKDTQAQAVEQRRLLAESWESQRQEWQDRTVELRQQREEQAAQLAHFVEERSLDREELGRLQQQVADLLQELEERTTRLIRLEDIAPQSAEQIARLQELAAQQSANQERLAELQRADEERYTQEIPLLQKLLDDLEKESKTQSGQLAQLLIEHVEMREALAMLQKELPEQRRSTEQTLADWRELLAQQRRRQIISLEQEAKELDALGKRKAE